MMKSEIGIEREKEKIAVNIGTNYCIKSNLYDIDRVCDIFFPDEIDEISFGITNYK